MKTRQLNVQKQSIGPIFARFFSSGVLKELAYNGHSVIAGRLAKQYKLFEQFGSDMPVGKYYDAIFKRLVREYRYEYIYKNAVAEKILLGIHNLNTSFMLTEFRADHCKADAVVLNGTSHVYEIKSEKDNFDRLDRQITAYRKIFDNISVITSEQLYEAVQEKIPQEIGIMVLSDSGYKFRKKPYREPTSNRNNVVPVAIFNSLQRTEYLKIIKEIFHVSLAELPNTQIYKESKKYFENLPPEVAHDKMVEVLKLRKNTRKVCEFVSAVPNSLKSSALSIRFTQEQRSRFIQLLNQDIATAFV